MSDHKTSKDVPPGGASGKPEGDPRKITYRVGWKSGTIRLQDKAGATRTPRGPSGGALSDFAPPAASRAAGTVGAARPAQAPRPPAKAAAPTAKASAPERAAAWLLRPAPQPTLNGWRYALAALPVAAFATLVWLAYRLSN